MIPTMRTQKINFGSGSTKKFPQPWPVGGVRSVSYCCQSILSHTSFASLSTRLSFASELLFRCHRDSLLFSQFFIGFFFQFQLLWDIRNDEVPLRHVSQKTLDQA